MHKRLVRILQLDEEERSHLFALARGPRPASTEQGREWRDESETYQAILDALGIYPAQLLDRYLNVVAWNESVSRVMGDVESRSLRERNIVWFLLMHPSARERLRDWERAARQGVALLRARSDRYAGSAWLTELVADLLHASPEFRAWWPQHDIRLECNGLGEINHPRVGHLVLQPTTLVMPSQPDLRMVVYTPLSQADTAAKLAALMT